jgi:uncharacterized protein (TIGR03437 family)
MIRLTPWSCFLLSLPLLAQPSRITREINDTHRVTLRGSLPARVQAADDRGRAESSLQLGYVVLTLKPTAGQQADLEHLLDEQQNRTSPNYHRWLTPEQFGDRFGLNAGDIFKVTAWIQSQGFHIETVAHARNWVAFSGSAGTAERAFGTEIHHYTARGEDHYSNSTELSIPEALADVVSGVRGLDDFSDRPLPAARTRGDSTTITPEYTLNSGASQLAPEDWATIYNVKPLYNAGIDGTGQRLAIVGTSAFTQSFVDSFRTMFGLPQSKIEMHLVGPDPGFTSSQNEAALDLEWSGAIAPKATIVYVYATNFINASQAVVDQNLATVMSESFGVCEPTSAQGNRAIAQQANAQGITWMASSGDSGGAACDPHGFFGLTGVSTPAVAGLWVSNPAAYPEVTAVGGTQFNEGTGNYWSTTNNANGGSALSYIPEMVWNETAAGGGLLASGGGASTYFPKPAWQTGPGVPNDNFRHIPDVSFSSSGNHDPYMVVNTNGLRATAGTSASSPAFAGVVALLNQYVVSKGMQTAPGLGNINPQLYRLAQTTSNVFHDITVGNNMVPCLAGSLDCTTGTLGFNAGPGYDQATGLGSIDIANLFAQWNTPAANTTTVVAVNPGNVALGGTVQVTAVVSAATKGSAPPSGTVTFTCGSTILGMATLLSSQGSAQGSATATLTVSGPQLPVGSASVIATYSGDSNFNGSAGTTAVNVAAAQPGSNVLISISPNPAHEGQFIRVTLTEVAGVDTTITGWNINGADDLPRFVPDFGTTALPAYGKLFSAITTAFPAVLPSPRVYTFTGVDGNGRQWSQQYTLILEGALSQALTLSGVPASVFQNPAADPSCQWSHPLVLQEQNGMEVQLTRMLANGTDWTSRIQQLFGTTHLAPLGNLQATICWPASNPASTATYEIDGTDQAGNPVTASVATSLAAPTPNPVAFSASPNVVTLTAAGSSQSATSSIALNLGSSTQPWTVSVFASNATAAWLTVSPLTGKGSQTVTVAASGAGLTTGVQYAWLVFQATGTTPQFIEVPVAFVVGASAAISIGGVTNGASFKPVFAPGMILSVFGTQLAPAVQLAGGLPLPTTMSGVSATVNGVAAPLYYVSPGQVNLQIPYETGSGPAVVGVNNNGQVASFVFSVAPTAPGIFADGTSALVPAGSGKRGDILSLFMTGEGVVSPPLPNGASPFSATPVSLLPQPTLPVSVTIGGVPAAIAFIGIPPGLAGTTQINFVIPPGAPLGVQPIVVTAGGVVSPAVKINVTTP